MLLVGGSARIKGLREALESACGCETLNWDDAEFATVLGALAEERPAPAVQPVAQPAAPPPEPAVRYYILTAHQSRQLAAAEEVGKSTIVFRDRLNSGGEGPEMVVIPAGEFLMGSPADEPERYDWEGPQHRVTLARPYALGQYPVTVGEFRAFARANGHIGRGAWVWKGGNWQEDAQVSWESPGCAQTDAHPVVCASYEDAQRYVSWLSEQTGKRCRLPSEAEWEYACRAGSVTPFWWGSTIDPEQANYDGNHVYNGGARGEYRERTVPVEQFEPNPFGLYQMHGNVWEWCADVWHEDYNGAPTNGSAWISGGEQGRRVFRGGSWCTYPQWLRSAYRFRYDPAARTNNLGFRLAQDL